MRVSGNERYRVQFTENGIIAMKINSNCASALVFAALAIAPTSYAASNAVVPGMGHDLAQRLCASCHLVEPGAVNPAGHVGGPAFQSVADQSKVTERSLRRHLRTTHTNAMIPLAMPNPQLSEDELIKIIGYIISLRPQD
jgi:mono/diheme cytochrome c family protein